VYLNEFVARFVLCIALELQSASEEGEIALEPQNVL
jgi:hypothetical protein